MNGLSKLNIKHEQNRGVDPLNITVDMWHYLLYTVFKEILGRLM